jgi:transketolase
MPVATTSIDQLAINTIRTLSMDAVEKAASGHPGTPMALAPLAYLLWNEVMRYDPAQPLWPGRDRFVLSCGHASMLLYSMLHLAGVRQVGQEGDASGADRSAGSPRELAVSLDEIKRFRQLHSRTPGHPEHGETAGVETTTGPLGQGCGNSVGMAIAQQWLAARYNRPGFPLFDYNVYVLCSDGDLMEGVANEAASLAGHLRLSNLCWIYDDNRITIEGSTSLAFTEDVATRFRGLGWHVTSVGDANDLPALSVAMDEFRRTADQSRHVAASLRDASASLGETRPHDRPTLIIVRSHIAWGAPKKQDHHDAHGAPLGADEVRATKGVYGWPEDQNFYVPDEVREHFRHNVAERGRGLRENWDAKLREYSGKYSKEAGELRRMWQGQLPERWDADIPTFPADAKGLATRASSGQVLNAIAKRVPWLIGGSADLAPSNNTTLKYPGAADFSVEQRGGCNFHFGVREHGMAAILNGMALSGLRPYGGTFLIFSDYCRPSIRLAALMRQPVLYVFTHDSIGLGEDGPTHQPVEHLAALRAIPNLVVLRPGDANEVAAAYRTILAINDRPVALVLTRQNLPTIDRARYASADGVRRGAYVLADSPSAKVILIGTGSELQLCVAAHEKLASEGLPTRVVSMPSWELFEQQDQAYRDSVLPPKITARIAVEAAVGQGWERYLGPRGRFIGMSTFGASAPLKDVMQHFGFTLENVVLQAKQVASAPSRT